MRRWLSWAGLVLVACGGPEAPPANVGTTTPARQHDPLWAENQRLAQREELDIQRWCERQGLAMERSGTGVRMRLVRDSAGVNAVPGQLAGIRFAVSLIDGRPCYASAPGAVEQFRIEEDNVESGLHEAIQRMSVGDSAVIVIPSHRAHGLIGDQDKIPMRSTVIYHLALVGLR